MPNTLELIDALRRRPVASRAELKAVGVSPDVPKVFVTGYSTGSTSGYDYATVAYSVA